MNPCRSRRRRLFRRRRGDTRHDKDNEGGWRERKAAFFDWWTTTSIAQLFRPSWPFCCLLFFRNLKKRANHFYRRLVHIQGSFDLILLATKKRKMSCTVHTHFIPWINNQKFLWGRSDWNGILLQQRVSSACTLHYSTSSISRYKDALLPWLFSRLFFKKKFK